MTMEEMKDDDDLNFSVDDDEEDDEDEAQSAQDADSGDGDSASSADQDDDDDDDDDGTEQEQYSARVQSRIKKLTRKFREKEREAEDQRRRYEAITAERDEALRIAQALHDRNTQMSSQLNTGHGAFYREAKGRVDAEINYARRELRDAMDTGDSEKTVEAQERLSEAIAKRTQVERMRPPENSSPEQRQQPQSQPQFQPQPQRHQASKEAIAWGQRNPWFETNTRMRSFAMGVSDDLIAKGIAPDSEKYYKEIDAEMRRTFPAAFGASPRPAAGGDDVVARPTRRAAKNPRTVRLTPTQVAHARRFGLSHEEYAAEIIKLEREEKNG